MSSNNIQEQKCPACGAPMRFDAASGKLVCDWCGTEIDISKDTPVTEEQQAVLDEKDGEDVSGFDFGALQHQVFRDDAEQLPIYHCKSCGAELISDWEQVTLTCPYCKNNIVLTDRVAGALRPDGVVPFRITSDQLPGAVNRFYKGKKLLSKKFFSQASMGRVTGLYVPFWVFSGKLDGTVDFTGQKSHSYRQGDYEITEVSHYNLHRMVDLDFADLPVDASDKLDDALMDSLEPFDLTDVKAFDPAYLAGFAADRFDVPADDMQRRAEDRMMNTAYESARSTCSGYSGVVSKGGHIRADVKAKYLLLPVYLFEIMQGGRSYSFAVNGQSGKVVGDLPDDKGFKFKYFLVRAAAVAAATLLISAARYFMGA
ncbi:MAG: zinc ribbon domain-containing protein [Firmicutes bacterium]|nr:zinc ribbon domain-containing protein [Bacillota bacterium]